MSRVSTESPGELSARLKEREMSYKILFDTAPLGIFMYSKDGQLLDATQFPLNMLGFPSLNTTKQINLFDYDKLKQSGISAFLESTLQHGTPQQMEVPYASKKGKTSFVNIISIPLIEENPFPEKAIALVQDITAQKKTQDCLLKSQIRFQLLADSIPLSVAIMDHEDHFEYMNPMFTTLFGHSVKETPTLQAWLDRVMPDITSRNIVVRLSRGQKNLEVRDADQQHVAVLCRDGSSRNVRFKHFP